MLPQECKLKTNTRRTRADEFATAMRAITSVADARPTKLIPRMSSPLAVAATREVNVI